MSRPPNSDRNSEGRGRFVVTLLVVVGVGLVGFGGWRLWQGRQVSNVVDQFLIALARGDRETAMSLLPDQLQSSLDQWAGGGEKKSWQPLPEFSFRIHHVSFVNQADDLTGAKSRKKALEQNKPVPAGAVDPALSLERIASGHKVAEVQVWIEREGFALKPFFLLENVKGQKWQIFEIQNFGVDPRWGDVQADKQREAGQNLSEELQKALEGQPGVTVERSPLK